MRDKQAFYDRLPTAGKRWFAVFIAAFILTIVMSFTVLPPIVHGRGLPFDTGKRVYTHELKSRWARRTLQVTAAEKTVLTVFQVLPWISIGSMIAVIICVARTEDR